MARLLEQYRKTIVPSLQEKLSRKNIHSLPRLKKIIVSMGVGRAILDRKILEEVMEHLALITGQKPQITRSRKAVAATQARVSPNTGSITAM